MNDSKSKIERLLKETYRAGMDDLLAWMDEAGFYNAPCSGKYHLAKPGGLAEHSLNVLAIATQLYASKFAGESNIQSFCFYDSIVICSLLHDLGKAGQFGKPNYIPEDLPFGKYTTNKELLYVPHEVRSVAIASRFIELTEEEQFAILQHNGMYGDLKNSLAGKETPLQMILHFADMWASRVVEKEG